MMLVQHREALARNQDAYTEDLKRDRLVKTLINHLRESFKTSGVRINSERRKLLKIVITLLFKAQDYKPMFHIENSSLPLCWNQPGDWKLDFIKYEWGHLLSINQNPKSINSIENMGLYSPRCNRHLQSSMDAEELKIYGGDLSMRTESVIIKRKALFNSQEWKKIKTQLYK